VIICKAAEAFSAPGEAVSHSGSFYGRTSLRLIASLVVRLIGVAGHCQPKINPMMSEIRWQVCCATEGGKQRQSD